jgi:hypothetical protein
MAKERGSERLLTQLFAGRHPSPEALGRAVAEAKAAGFLIERWWWKGQPAIDWIKATLRVDRESLGATVEGLAGLHSAEQQVNLEVFPYGIPVPDVFHVGVEINRNLQKIPG